MESSVGQSATHDLPSRVSRLETVVGTIHEDLLDLKKNIKDLADSISNGTKTNWTTIFAGLALIGGLYAAALRPLINDIERQSISATKIADAVLVQNIKVESLQLEMIKANAERAMLVKEFDSVREKGSPLTDKRLVLLEYRLSQLEPHTTPPQVTE